VFRHLVFVAPENPNGNKLDDGMHTPCESFHSYPYPGQSCAIPGNSPCHGLGPESGSDDLSSTCLCSIVLVFFLFRRPGR